MPIIGGLEAGRRSKPGGRCQAGRQGKSVLLEAVGFAFLAAVNPSALLIGAAYLGSANPRKTVVFYLAGAIIMTAVLGVVILVAIRAGGLSQVGNRTPRYGLRLGLGAVALVGAVVVARRQPKTAPGRPAKPAETRPAGPADRPAIAADRGRSRHPALLPVRRPHRGGAGDRHLA